jgi:LysM repeat protein
VCGHELIPAEPAPEAPAKPVESEPSAPPETAAEPIPEPEPEAEAEPEPEADEPPETPEEAIIPERRPRGMPRITLSLPVVVILMALFLTIGAVLVYIAMQNIEPEVEEVAQVPTLVATITPTLTPTQQPPTRIPPTPLPTLTPLSYTVQAGDTCLGIAVAFDVSVQSIVRNNRLPADCSALVEGQELKIPNPTPTATPTRAATLNATERAIEACEKVEYTVGENDTLSSISQTYEIPMDIIRMYNNMHTNAVYWDTQIIIPLCERANADQTPVPTQPPAYPALDLLFPPDGASYSEDDNLVLQWAAIGRLQENEAYSIVIEDMTGGAERRYVEYLEDTKLIVPTDFLSEDGGTHLYRWWVLPVRQEAAGEGEDPVWKAAGDASATRVFVWVAEP